MPRLEEDPKTLVKLRHLANDIVRMIHEGHNPYIERPVRSKSNVVFDRSEGYLKLGGAMSKRYFMNIAHARKFMQSLLIASRCKDLVTAGKTASVRELYYQLKHTIPGTDENTLEDQSESDPVIVDLETALDSLREQLHLVADPKGSIFGPITIEDQGDRIDCMKLGKSGLSIPSIVDDYNFVDHDANYILVVETAAMVARLVEEGYHKKHKAIILSSKGQSSRGVRRLIARMNRELELPVYMFTDGDPWGYYIYAVMKAGSINLAFESKRLATPSARLIGMTMDDIGKYDLMSVTEKLKGKPAGKPGGPSGDYKRTKDMLEYPWFHQPEWQRQLKKMMEMGVRVEQQALASKKLSFVSETYLPEKIKNEDFLP